MQLQRQLSAGRLGDRNKCGCTLRRQQPARVFEEDRVGAESISSLILRA